MAQPREVVNVTFRVHTRDQPESFPVSALDLSTLSFSSFNPRRPTKFVIHGYLNGRDMPWLEVSVGVGVSVGEGREGSGALVLTGKGKHWGSWFSVGGGLLLFGGGVLWVCGVDE